MQTMSYAHNRITGTKGSKKESILIKKTHKYSNTVVSALKLNIY